MQFSPEIAENVRGGLGGRLGGSFSFRVLAGYRRLRHRKGARKHGPPARTTQEFEYDEVYFGLRAAAVTRWSFFPRKMFVEDLQIA